jgi:hypothetical protein
VTGLLAAAVLLAAAPHPHWAEGSWSVRRGVLTIVEPRGGQSVCCPGRAYISYRWTGTDLVVGRTRLVRQHY